MIINLILKKIDKQSFYEAKLKTFIILFLAISLNAFAAKSNVQTVTEKYTETNWINVGAPRFISDGWVATNSLAIAPKDDTPYIAYMPFAYNRTVVVAKFDGVNWINLSREGLNDERATNSSLKIAPDGVIYLASTVGGYQIPDKTKIYRFDGTKWVNIGEFPGTYGTAPKLVISPKDNMPYIAFSNNERTTIKAMRFNRTTWEQIGHLDIKHYKLGDLVISPGGTPYLSFSEYFGRNKYQAKVMKLDDSRWIQVGNTIDDFSQTSLAISPDGNLYVAGDTAYCWLDVNKYNGTTWENISTIRQCGAPTYDLKLTIISNLVYLTFGKYLFGVNNPTYAVAPNDAWLLSFAFSANGTPYLGYMHDNTNAVSVVKAYKYFKLHNIAATNHYSNKSLRVTITYKFANGQSSEIVYPSVSSGKEAVLQSNNNSLIDKVGLKAELVESNGQVNSYCTVKDFYSNDKFESIIVRLGIDTVPPERSNLINSGHGDACRYLKATVSKIS